MRHFWSQYILGGTEVEDFSQFPYALSLRYVEIHVCGASIIALNWESILLFKKSNEQRK